MTQSEHLHRPQQKSKPIQRNTAPIDSTEEELLKARGLKSTTSLSPAALLQLQRTIGNQATIKATQRLQRTVVPNIQRGKGDGYGALLDEEELEDQDAPEQLTVGGSGDSGKVGQAASGGSGASAVKGVVDASSEVASASSGSGLSGMAAANHAKGVAMVGKARELGSAFTDSPDANDSALQGMMTPLRAMKTFFEDAAVSSISGVFSIGALIYSTYSKFNNWTAYDKAAQATVTLLARESDDDSDKLSLLTKSQGDTELGAAAVYAAAKTKRGFFTLLFRSIMKVAQYIARMITLFTGGMSAIVTQAVDVAAGLTVAAEKGARAAKGFYKAITGKRGKNRTKSANVVVDEAIGGDNDALQLMIDLDLFGLGWTTKLKAKSFMTDKAEGIMGKLGAKVKLTPTEKTVLTGESPKTTEAMQIYLLLCQKVGIIKDVKESVSGSMKSQ